MSPAEFCSAVLVALPRSGMDKTERVSIVIRPRINGDISQLVVLLESVHQSDRAKSKRVV